MQKDDEFWELIAASRRGLSADNPDGNLRLQLLSIRDLLRGRGPDEIIEFGQFLSRQRARADTSELLAAASLIAEGCSDDAFEDFRSWLVSLGEPAFSEIVSNPDELVTHATAPEVEDIFFGELTVLPEQQYRDLTGKQLPIRIAPAMEAAPLSEDAIAVALPRLWARFR
jgi:hypothetical protein